MRILIYGLNFTPELTGVGKYTGELAEWLANRGHDVRAVVAPPYYPMWRAGEGYSLWRYRRERIGAVDVFRCPLWVPARDAGWKRLLHLASFAASSLPVLIRHIPWRPDIVFAIEPTLLAAPQAWLTGRLARSLVWLHVQDFEVDAAFQLGLLRSPALHRLAEKAERWIMARFDRASAISGTMVQRLRDKGVSGGRAVLLKNWVDTSEIFPLDEKSGFRQELQIPDQTVVALYAGNLGEKQGLETLVGAARRLTKIPDLMFVIAGEGVARSRLLEQAGDLPNVVWLPLQPVNRLNSLLNAADIHLLPQRQGAADLVMPSKLTGMLASGRPVVAAAEPNTQVAEALDSCGTVVPPGDVGALVNAIVRLARDTEERSRLGSAARRYAVEHFSKQLILEQLEGEFRRGRAQLPEKHLQAVPRHRDALAEGSSDLKRSHG